MMRRNSTSRRVQTLSSDSIRSDEIAATDIALSRGSGRAMRVVRHADAAHLGIEAMLLGCTHGRMSWPVGAAKSIADEARSRRGDADGRKMLELEQIKADRRLQEYRSHGDQIRASDRNARRAAAADRPRRHLARPRDPPAPQPQGRMGAAAGARKRAHHRRSDLAAVRGRRQQQARAGRLDARRRAPQRRSGGARRRARGEARHPLHRAVSLHRAVAARRDRHRGAQRRQSGLPGGARDQEGISRSRRALRRGARSLHQPRP